MPDWKRDILDLLAFRPLDVALFGIPVALLRHHGLLPAPSEEEK